MKTANSFICKSETPEEVLTPLGFLARFGELVRSGCYCPLVTIQPSAYVVTYYTCSDRN